MVYAVGYPYTDALRRLKRMVQSTYEPVLSAADLSDLLTYAAITDESGNLPDAWPAWAASTAYPINYRVVPAVRNGYVFRVTIAGTSGSSAPSWPTTIDELEVDGTVTWNTEATAAWTPTYSEGGLNRAALEGWQTKFNMLTPGETFSSDGATFNPETRRADIEKAMNFYRRKIAGSFRLTGRTSRLENWDDTQSLAVNG